MENVVIIGILLALALACEWWLRKHEAKSHSLAEDAQVDVPARSLPAGLPEAFPADPLSTRWPSTPSLN